MNCELKLEVIGVDGGYMIKVSEGVLPNGEKYDRHLKHVYKHKYVAESRKKTILKEINQ